MMEPSDDYPYLVRDRAINIRHIHNMLERFTPVIWNEKEITKRMNVRHRAGIQPYDGSYLVIYDNWKKTEDINSITDMFSEKIRVKCSFGENKSPFEYWKTHRMHIIKIVRPLSIHNLREYLYANTKLCNNFRITVALAILHLFQPKKWLDISAGWGDRLLASIFYKVELYVSTDPNLDLHPCYKEIIRTLVPEEEQHRFIIYPTGFEVAELPDTKFDIVFSSPPFFTLERYSDHPDDSLKYSTEDLWCTQFLWPSLIKAYTHLKRNGHMILYMSGSSKVMSYLQQLNLIMKYKGVIYFFDTIPRAMYVWQKVS